MSKFICINGEEIELSSQKYSTENLLNRLEEYYDNDKIFDSVRDSNLSEVEDMKMISRNIIFYDIKTSLNSHQMMPLKRFENIGIVIFNPYFTLLENVVYDIYADRMCIQIKNEMDFVPYFYCEFVDHIISGDIKIVDKQKYLENQSTNNNKKKRKSLQL